MNDQHPGGYRSSRLRASASGTTVLPPAEEAVVRAPRRLLRAAADVLSLPLVALLPRRRVPLADREIPLEYEFRTFAWRNERCVELGLGRRALEAHAADATLEVGNVMPLHGSSGHTVVDKYERGAGVINEDIVDYDAGRRFSLVLSLSTLEHVGFDEQPSDPAKAPLALSRMASLVADGGALLVTIPVAYNRELEEHFVSSEAPFDEVVLFAKRSRLARWEQRPVDERLQIHYAEPYACGNGLLVGFRGDPFGAR